ncbi:F16A1-like protein [Mya arenaria]|uniref:F16A1-like protein n=1 Tax=Mya arenaria TaxID=6604 RepID=A0ABY7DPM7_MYAAR|nr:FHF complex subunit HOOK interacting protein 1B-like isoform X2 [Mya arenaria]WAQ99642.1 F16A1-like protein [Mya arenaria]
MSWFNKIRSDSRTSSDVGSEGSAERRSRRDTDPGTCLEVFQNHWHQAYKIIERDVENAEKSTDDEINAVSHNFEQMVTLLAEEDGEDGQGMPGPILHFLLEQEILEKFCGWCHRYHTARDNLVNEELRMFETLISQSHQLLLIHKPVIRPLLNLLAYCSDGYTTPGVEENMVLVLHQLCVCISKERVILESFFNMNADHGAAKFLIFSLLIPFIHREGKVGQQARDALLLIMTLSAKYPYIGQYIADNSDFCPVLATGLSGLYSDLPRKIVIPREDWCQMTDEDVQRMPTMAMFLNSLEFCNAVAQIAHPLVRDQLIKFIYNGFLVPVLGPALHQDISGLPTPLLDSPMFSNSREEVITATAYLDLFLRKISEPSLVRAFLAFIFTERNDEIVILDSLVTRINSSSKLCLVSLSLFHTLVDLNCEDVMFDLVFKYLIPCRHVMVSQRRAVKDQDIYCKSAEKFLSLRPTCCLPEIDSPKHSVCDMPTNMPKPPSKPGRKLFRSKRDKTLTQNHVSDPSQDKVNTAFPPGTFGSKLEDFETSYLEYLADAHLRVLKCSQACHSWQYPYDGDDPPFTSFDVDPSNQSIELSKDFTDSVSNKTDESKFASTDAENVSSLERTDGVENNSNVVPRSCDNSDFSIVDSAIVKTDIGDDDISLTYERASKRGRFTSDEDFITMLEESAIPQDKSANVEDSLKNLESVLTTVSQTMSISCTSTPRKDRSLDGESMVLGAEGEMSSVYFDCETSHADDSAAFKSIDDTSFDVIDDPTRQKTTNATEFEIVDTQITQSSNKTKAEQSSKPSDITSFIDISSAAQNSDTEKLNSDTDSMEVSVHHFGTEIPKSLQPVSGILVTKATEEEKVDGQTGTKGDKSVRFSETTQVQTIGSAKLSFSIGLNPSVRGVGTPNIGPFLTAVLLKLESMMQNTLPVNLMLTGLISRLAVYSQPLLRSFLLNHNLVFQPTVKSLVQVLTSIRQRVDHYSYTIQNFEALLLRARRTLAHREGNLPERAHSQTPSPELNTKLRASTAAEMPSKEKRHRTLTELLFRRNTRDKKSLPSPNGNGNKLELLTGNRGMRYIHRRPDENPASYGESLKTRNAVYCAIVLEEFVKELASLTQEHSILLHEDEEL